ncbi:hypothetical protein V5E97_19335 [Singulisphaera sp. Ch08]|uniref:Uncharacterized protein n=1 Tax=Singulisphaera sp. Ch08 TaxID=3120278 RepID=A0AAU7CSV6_9BACT
MNSSQGRRTAMPCLETLESRMMLTAAPAVVSAVAADRRYVDALVGQADSSQPSLETIRDRMTSALARGASRERVVRLMLESTPADQDQVRGVYRLMLHRDPTPQELRRGKAVLDNGQDIRVLAKRLAGSAGYYTQVGGGTTAGFVTALDRTLLGRNPTDAELARALTEVERPGGRRRFAASVIDGLEFRTNMAQATLAEQGRQPTAAELARAVRILAAPGGYLRLQTQVLGSKVVYDQLSVAPPIRTETPRAGDSPAPLSLVPSFTSGAASLVAPPTDGSYPIAVAGADGSFFVGGPGGLLIYHPTGLYWSSFGDGEPVLSASAISDNEIWVIEGPTGGQPTLVHYVAGQAVTVPTLPSGTVPHQISAATDGTIWFVDSNGSILTLSAVATAWTPMSGPGGAPVSAVAVGSAGNTWALSGPAGATQLYRYTTTYGWIPDPSFTPGVLDSIYACADGSSWAAGNGQAYVHPVFGFWYGVNSATISGNLVSLAPYSQLQAFNATTPAGGGSAAYSLATIGLVDQQPDTSFPTWTPNQQLIYNYISQAVLQLDYPGGLRALYGSQGSSADSWGNLIDQMSVPSQFTSADWDVVVVQLLREFEAVTDVENLFTQINGLNSAIESAQALDIPGIQSIITASNPGPNTSTYIRLALEGLVEAVVAGIGVVAGPEAAVAAAVINSALTAAASEVEASLGGGGGNGAAIQYGEFTQTQAQVFSTAAGINGGYEQSILGDYGRLMEVSYLINSGTWYWSPTLTNDLVNAATPIYQVYDYLSLLPAQWQVVEFEYTDYFHVSISKVVNAFGFESYATVTTENGHHLGAPKYDILFSNQVGAQTNLNKAPFVSFGPYPTSTLINTIGSLPGLSINDFWSRSNGWDNVRYVRAPSQPEGS